MGTDIGGGTRSKVRGRCGDHKKRAPIGGGPSSFSFTRVETPRDSETGSKGKREREEEGEEKIKDVR